MWKECVVFYDMYVLIYWRFFFYADHIGGIDIFHIDESMGVGVADKQYHSMRKLLKLLFVRKKAH